MTPLPICSQTPVRPCPWRWVSALSLTFAMALPGASNAQDVPRGATSASVASVRTAAKPAAEQGVRWSEMKPAQQASLKPLEQDWSRIDGSQKQKWLQVAAGFPKLSAPEQARVQARMADWAKLTPQERGQARLNFQEATQVPAQDRQDRWDAYQALSAEQKRQLAARAAMGASASAGDTTRRPSTSEGRSRTAPMEPVQSKSNIVPNPALASRPKPVSPTVVQASPGATTTTISKRPMPPSHQQAGMPKIAATPEFVNKETLLPQRGPQGAAIHPEPASDPAPAPRQ